MSSQVVAEAPKYAQIAQLLRDQIQSGDLRAGDRLPSYAEMRDRGVSQPTLDRVHALLEREGLIVREHGRGVFVADSRTAPLQHQGILGMLGLEDKSWADPYWAHLLSGARKAAHDLGFDILLLGSRPPFRWERVDGLLMGGYSGLEAAKGRPKFLPAVGLMTEGTRTFPAFTSDDRGAGRIAAEHLLQLGHERIAFLYAENNPRLAGYFEALEAAGVKAPGNWIRPFLPEGKKPGWRFADYGREALSRWIREDWHSLGATALICHNDEVAIGALKAFAEAGIRVPRDVSVVGFDGTELAAHADPALTTVEIPLEAIGARGVETLLSLMHPTGARIPRGTTRFPAQLRLGESTARPERTDG